MFRKWLLLIMSFGLLSGVAYAQDSYTISGQVSFQYEGNIHICVLTMEGLRDFVIPRHKLSESPCKIVQMNPDQKKAGKVSFEFKNVPKGTYCVFTYQDVNMNGEVDFENYSMKEPWGSFRETAYENPHWNMIRFDLKEDMKGIEIHM